MQNHEQDQIDTDELHDLEPESVEADHSAVSKLSAAMEIPVEDLPPTELEEELEAEASTPEIEEEDLPLSLTGKVEAIIFAAPKPIRVADIQTLLQDETITSKEIQLILKDLVNHYQFRQGGFRLQYVKRQGFQFQTVPKASFLMERQFATRPRPLSRSAMETMAIIAYRQPVTRADVEFIRGVDSGGIIKSLMDRQLVACVGRKQDLGRPMLFGTTDEFLKIFNLPTIKDLPPLESFQPPPEMVQAAFKQLDEDQAINVEAFVSDDEYQGERALQGAVLDKNPDKHPMEDPFAEFEEERSTIEENSEQKAGDSTGGGDPALTEVDIPAGFSVTEGSRDLD